MNFRGNCLRALAFATYLAAIAYPARLGAVPFPYGGYGMANNAHPYGGAVRVYGGGYGSETPVPSYTPPLFR